MIATQTIEEYIQLHSGIINTKLAEYINSLSGVPENLRESVKYSLLSPGKRLRPILMLLTMESLGADIANAYSFACAIEMIHTYSLIHDDLPCMDDDDYRRGQLTNHKVFGEACAVLSGDALLTEAFGLIVQGAKQQALDAAIMYNIIEDMVLLSGARGMIGGQALDIAEDIDISLDQLEHIYRHKTGDLIVLSIRMGARIAGASADVIELLSRFAYVFGMAFQIRDDILDITGSDADNSKTTYPTMIGLERSEHMLAKLVNLAEQELVTLRELYSNHNKKMDIDSLCQLVKYAAYRDY